MTLAFDFDTAISLQDPKLFKQLKAEGHKIVIVSWKAAALMSYKQMVISLIQHGLLSFTDRIERIVPPDSIYISSRCICTEGNQSLLSAIKQLSKQEENDDTE